MRLITKTIVLLAAVLMTSAVAVAQITVGYTNGTLSRNDILRFGATEKQGMAVYVDAEKAALLKGATLKSFFTFVSTTQIKDGTLFITKELGGESVCVQPFVPKSSRERMTEYAVESAYVFDGEPFYLGYTLEAATSYKPLSFDLSDNTEAGISWVYENGNWIDVSTKGFGVPNIQIAVEGIADFTDLMVRPIQAEGYQVAGKEQVFGGQIFNFGSQSVTSFDLTCSLGDSAPVTTSVSGISLASGDSYEFTLPAFVTNESGMLDLKVSVTNINGGTDAEMTDNTATSNVYFYPVGVEKKILIEAFSTQLCAQCPTGHANLSNAIAGIEDEFIEVAHHVGFGTDQFSFEESYQYTWFYAEAGTFAPGFMFNRTIVPSISSTTVVFEGTNSNVVKVAAQAFRSTQPYVSLNLYNQFDTVSRKGTLVVDVETFVEPSDSMHTLNVWLVQDGLVAMQSSAGSNYVHNHVFRGTLLGNAWGQQIALTPGETVRRTINYEIPEAIAATFGDYKGTEFAAIPADMQIVAFVSDFSGSKPTMCNVYNATKTPLLANNMAEGIEAATGDIERPLFSYDGRLIRIAGQFTQADIYAVDGAQVASLTAGESTFMLPTGLYIVRTTMPSGYVDVQKLLIK